MINKRLAGAFWGLMLWSAIASAHHSMAMFQPVEERVLNGTVIRFEWTNPHTWIEMDVVDADGKTTQWSVEGGSVVALQRQGWRRTTLKPGDKITVAIHQLRDGRPGGSLIGMLAADGRLYGQPVTPPAAK
jgi:hypothetical protein